MIDTEGKRYANASLPSVIKNYPIKALSFVVIYAGDEFCILSLTALWTKIYPKCNIEAQKRIRKKFSNERRL